MLLSFIFFLFFVFLNKNIGCFCILSPIVKAVAVELGFKEERVPSLPFTLLHLLEQNLLGNVYQEVLTYFFKVLFYLLSLSR